MSTKVKLGTTPYWYVNHENFGIKIENNLEIKFQSKNGIGLFKTILSMSKMSEYVFID